MAKLQTFHLSHLPPELAVHVALYQGLQNATFLRQQLLDGNPAFEYALIDAGVIVSTTHALAAVFRAVNDMLNGRLKSRNVHSEIVFSLSPNNNIAESFRRFGVSDTTRDLLVIKVGKPPEVTAESVGQHLDSVVEGMSVEVSDGTLAQTADLARVRKIYKLNSGGKASRSRGQHLDDASAESEKAQQAIREVKELEVNILGLIALRGA